MLAITNCILTLFIKGKGTPILFEAGNGDDGSVWQSITNEIHKQTKATIITYDRAGLGKSEIDTTKISFQKEVKDLEIALKKLGYSKKVFIVCLVGIMLLYLLIKI